MAFPFFPQHLLECGLPLILTEPALEPEILESKHIVKQNLVFHFHHNQTHRSITKFYIVDRWAECQQETT